MVPDLAEVREDLPPGTFGLEGTRLPVQEENGSLLTTCLWGKHIRVQPDDMARACVFLASDDARRITGELLRLHGGQATASCGRRFPERPRHRFRIARLRSP